MRTLAGEGIVQDNLVKVDGVLVDLYNAALQKAVGKTTALKKFFIDKRGESAEVEQELGDNYLQTSPAQRFAIVVSPNQKDATLLHEEFSFDSRILDALYEQFMQGIDIITRVDSLYGELDDGMSTYTSLEDLLLVNKVKLHLDTPSGFIGMARELKDLLAQLNDPEKGPERLIANDEALPKRIYTLVEQVGDVSKYDIHDITLTTDVSTFSTRFFNGLFVFRNYDTQTETAPIRRPSFSSSNDALLQALILARLAPKKSAERIERQTVSTGKKTMVIYTPNEFTPEDGPTVQYLPITDKESIVSFLLTYNFARYDPALLEKRISRLEDVYLLKRGIDPTNAVERASKLQRPRPSELTKMKIDAQNVYEHATELAKIRLDLRKGFTFEKLIEHVSAEAKAALLTPTMAEAKGIVPALLTRLWPYDYETMLTYDRRSLENTFQDADNNMKDYLVKVLRQNRTARQRDI
ncbi:MAG: DUF6638 family protein [archaeon]